MKKAATLLILVILVIAPLFATVTVLNTTATGTEEKEVMQDNVPLNIFQEASDIQREVRVALYDEPSASPPSYASTGLVTTNITLAEIFLTDAGFAVTRLTASEIDGNDTLRTALFDVFVMVDNNPRDSITDEILSFWRGGGGILSIDGAVSFLCHFGVMVPASTGNHGHGPFWTYSWSMNQTVLNRHPVSQDFVVDDIITDELDWAAFDWSALQGYSYTSEYTAITHATTGANWVNTLARDTVFGGRVVQTFGDANPIAVGHDAMIIDAINWLCPRPKARVVFDYSHFPYYGIDAGDPHLGYDSQDRYANMRDALVNRTYTVDKLYPSPEGNLTAENLAPYDILVISTPNWNYSAAEVAAVTEWVSEGGGLFVMGDYAFFADENLNVNYLLGEFDMKLNTSEYSPISFATTEAEMHPTLESVTTTYYSGGSYVNVTGDAYPLWHHGPNIVSAAQEYGAGRVILMGDINLPSTEFDTNDNTQYVINLMNWISSGPAQVLLYVDEPLSVNHYRTPVANALNELGIDYYLTFGVSTNGFYLNLSLHLQEWHLVIVDNPWWGISSKYLEFKDYIESGGRFLMSSYQVNSYQSSPLWPMLGFEYAAQMPDEVELFPWDVDDPIFNIPHDFNGIVNFTPDYDYGDEGDMLTVFENATALAGFSNTTQDGNASIVVRNDGMTLYNAYLIDEFSFDLDDSTYADNFELWLNEIAYMLRATIDEPADVEYVEGTTGHSIVWHPHSVYPVDYLIERDGGLVEHEPWVEDTITLDIDGLANGTYVFVIAVMDRAGFTAIDEVVVTVTEVPTTPPTTPTTTTPTTTPPTTPPDSTLLIIIAGGAAVVIIIVIILISKKKGS